MTEEHAGDDVWRIPLDDLIEHIGAVGEGVCPVPAAEYVSHDPRPLARILGLLQLLDEEGEYTRVVGIGCVYEGIGVGLEVEV